MVPNFVSAHTFCASQNLLPCTLGLTLTSLTTKMKGQLSCYNHFKFTQNKCEIRKCFTYRGNNRKNVTGTVIVFKRDEY